VATGYIFRVQPLPDVPPPPEDPQELLAWARAHLVSDRLDDVVIGVDGAAGSSVPGRWGERFTYRDLLIDGAGGPAARRRHHDGEETARRFLHRMATLVAAQQQRRAFLQEQGRDPDDEVLAAFLERLRGALRERTAERDRPPRAAGTFEPVKVEVAREPVPMLRYQEWTLANPGGRWAGALEPEEVALLLLGWNEGALRWARYRGAEVINQEVSADEEASALAAMIDLLRDPGCAREQEELAEVLRLPAWQVALGTLDEQLARLDAQEERAAAAPEERVAFRVTYQEEDAFLDVEPVVQKRLGGGEAAPGRDPRFSKGARLQWYQLPDRRDLSPADRRAYQAYDDRFARRSQGWSMGSGLSHAQLFGVLRALIDHPAVFFEAASPLKGGREGAARSDPRLEIRLGRLRLRFNNAADCSLQPQFELLGVALLAGQVGQGLRDGKHLVHLHRPDSAPPQVLLAQVSAPAAVLVQALALAPGRFPPEAHDALAARLETLQETLDVEFPSAWTRTIAPADGRLLVRLDLLASGALAVTLSVRPVKLGAVFAPGEGPSLVLEGQGRDRHGARRDLAAERQAGHALAERLGLDGGRDADPPAGWDQPGVTGAWSWRVAEGDPALHLVATLKDLGDEVQVEWADDRLVLMGSVGRAHMRLKVADQRDWFAVQGGAQVEGVGAEVVPLFELLAAIREGRRYVRVGARGFVRLEETLRAALEKTEAALFEYRGTIQLAGVAQDPLIGLVEQDAQIEASAAFSALRRRVLESAEVQVQLPEALAERLRPYQRAGVAWLARLAHWGAGAILADEMGLGKTIQTLALLAHRAQSGPALVVAPTSVVPNWVAEAARFVPELKVRLYRGKERESGLRGLGPGDVIITSYAIATLDAEALAAIEYGTLVIDEAQAVKNATTERSKALRALRAGWRLGLTGTPIENHVGELWSIFRLVSPGLLGSWEQFRGRYAVPIEKFGDQSRQRALAGLIRPYVLRRTKAEVAPELPARTEIVRTVQLSSDELALYEQLRQSTLAELERAKEDPDRDAGDMRFVLLAAITRLRQLCCHPRLVYPRAHTGSSKAAALAELLEQLREEGHKTLVFSQFRSFLEILAPRLRQQGLRLLLLDGTTPAETREQRIAAFQAGEADVFLISLKAGGFGLNLTAADTVIHLDPWWNPAVEDQATSRAHRIGQPRPVTAVRLVARDTIEEAVLGLHAAKRALAAGVLEGTDLAATLSSDELVSLIRTGGEGG
jgi:superfamily II DNA or RNA helicase